MIFIIKMETKNKIPNTKINRFYDDIDFNLELEMASELINEDMNFTVILYRIDRDNSNYDDIYGESNPQQIRYLTPVELKAILTLTTPENKNYDTNGRLRYQEYGNLTFDVLNRELSDKNVDISYGDIVAYSDKEDNLKYFEVFDDGIVFTAGDNDTYALWIVQEAMNYRKDITVINTSMIQIDDYRGKLFKEKGLAPFDFDKKEPSTTALFKHIFENKAKIPVHVSTSASGQFTDTTITDNLYLTGLTYIYSLEDVENIAVIKRNFEKRFLLDHLTKTFSYSYGDLDARIKQMYLPGLMKLYMHSKTADDLEGIAYYKGLIDSIGNELGVEAEIKKALAE